MNKIYKIKRHDDIDWEEDIEMVVVAKDLEDAKQLIINENWSISVGIESYKNKLKQLRNTIQNITETDINNGIINNIISITEIDINKSDIILISNKGA